MITQEVDETIAVYHRQRSALINVIRRNNGQLHQDNFDEIFRDRMKVYSFYLGRGPIPQTRQTVILGAMLQQSDWHKWLSLLQHMVSIKDSVRLEVKDKECVYVLMRG
jgi:hypothetical protein